jgi:hypothetical protein
MSIHFMLLDDALNYVAMHPQVFLHQSDGIKPACAADIDGAYKAVIVITYLCM